MTSLARPDVRLHGSWAAAVREFGTEWIHGSRIGDRVADGSLTLDEAGCAALVAELASYADPGATRPGDEVPCDFYWLTDGVAGAEEVVGFLAVRHRLNAWLLEEGGHIGYSVRPTRRRQGHARRGLDLALVRARELGLDRVLITCDEDNHASRATIEGAGGAYEDSRRGKRRYWVSLSAPRSGR